MISCILLGGLGNQLFQIFTTIAYSLKHNVSFYFLFKNQTIGITFRKTYWDSFLIKLQPYLLNEESYKKLNFLKWNEKIFNYIPIPSFPNNNNIELYGYFQSPLYFNEYKNEIFSLINLKNIKKNFIYNSKYNNLNFENVISMHFRIGDYKKLQHIHPLLDINYYKSSLEKICLSNKLENFHVLYFCEKHDFLDVEIIINQLKNEFSNITFECIDFSLDDWKQVLLMSFCRVNIIANSTFSWWGAYFNDNLNKTIIYPNKWFNHKNNLEIKDLFPTEWISI